MVAGIHPIPASTAPRTPARRTAVHVAAAALVLLTLAGCAQFSPDGGLGPAFASLALVLVINLGLENPFAILGGRGGFPVHHRNSFLAE